MHNSNEFHNICVNKRFRGSFTPKKAVTSIKKGFGGPKIKNLKIQSKGVCSELDERKTRKQIKHVGYHFHPENNIIKANYSGLVKNNEVCACP